MLAREIEKPRTPRREQCPKIRAEAMQSRAVEVTNACHRQNAGMAPADGPWHAALQGLIGREVSQRVTQHLSPCRLLLKSRCSLAGSDQSNFECRISHSITLEGGRGFALINPGPTYQLCCISSSCSLRGVKFRARPGDAVSAEAATPEAH